MASEAKNRANRTNALRSTGPRTVEGKAVSRLNALKHGIVAEHVVLPNEDAKEFAAFKNDVRQDLQPVGTLEALNADQIAAFAWRLRRVMRVEMGIFLRGVYGQMAENARRKVSQHVSFPDSLETRIASYTAEDQGEPVIDDPQAHKQAIERTREVEAIRDSDDGLLGDAFMRDAAGADTLAKLSRYEAHIQRSMFRALEELQRLQTARLKTEAMSSDDTSAPPELA